MTQYGEYCFKKDIVKGRMAEDYVSFLIQKNTYNVEHIEKNYNRDYDILVIFKDGARTTIEVKIDFMARNTGNIAVEKFCRGKLSGINTTIADYIVYVIPDFTGGFRTVIYRSETLKNLCERFKNVSGGDVDVRGNISRPTTIMSLIPVDFFIKNGREMIDGNVFRFGLAK